MKSAEKSFINYILPEAKVETSAYTSEIQNKHSALSIYYDLHSEEIIGTQVFHREYLVAVHLVALGLATDERIGTEVRHWARDLM